MIIPDIMSSKQSNLRRQIQLFQKLGKAFSEFGISDMSRQTTGRLFNNNAFQFLAPRWPRASGEVERFVWPIKKVIKTANVERKNWKQEMYGFFVNVRAASHSFLCDRAIWSGNKLEFNTGQQEPIVPGFEVSELLRSPRSPVRYAHSCNGKSENG